MRVGELRERQRPGARDAGRAFGVWAGYLLRPNSSMSQPRKIWPRTKLMMSAGQTIHAGSSGMGFIFTALLLFQFCNAAVELVSLGI